MQGPYRVLETRTICGVFSSRSAARRAVEALVRGGFDEEHVSMVMRRSRETGPGSQLTNGSSAGIDMRAGATSQFTLQMTPTSEPLLAAGPMVSRLSGAPFVTNMGVLAGAIVGGGIPPAQAKEIEIDVLQGKVLVTYICRNDVECEQVPDLFRGNGAELVACTPAEGYPAAE